MKLSITSFIILIILQCNTLKGEEYSIQGTIKNATHKTIYLQKLSHKTIITVDSANIDAKKSFRMKGNVEQTGFYRLILNPKEHNPSKVWLLSLSPKEKITCTIDEIKPTEYTIAGDDLQLDFQTALKTVNSQQSELVQLTTQFQKISNSNPNSKDVTALSDLIKNKSEAFNVYLSSVLKNAKNPITKYYLYSIIVQQYRGQEIPKDLISQIELYSKELSQKLPKSVYSEDFTALLQSLNNSQPSGQNLAQSLEVGSIAPDVELIDAQGVKTTLNQMRGKLVLLDFWASWCAPCRRENPNVVAAYNKYKDKGFVVMSISQDKDLNKWKQAIIEDQLVWNSHYADLQTQFAASQKYQVNYIPRTFLIDRDGRILAKDLRGPMLEMELSKVLK